MKKMLVIKLVFLASALVANLAFSGVAEIRSSGASASYTSVENTHGATRSNPGFVTNEKGQDMLIDASQIKGGTLNNVALGSSVTGAPKINLSNSSGTSSAINSKINAAASTTLQWVDVGKNIPYSIRKNAKHVQFDLSMFVCKTKDQYAAWSTTVRTCSHNEKHCGDSTLVYSYYRCQ